MLWNSISSEGRPIGGDLNENMTKTKKNKIWNNRTNIEKSNLRHHKHQRTQRVRQLVKKLWHWRLYDARKPCMEVIDQRSKRRDNTDLNWPITTEYCKSGFGMFINKRYQKNSKNRDPSGPHMSDVEKTKGLNELSTMFTRLQYALFSTRSWVFS